jgi:hypothetical protein
VAGPISGVSTGGAVTVAVTGPGSGAAGSPVGATNAGLDGWSGAAGAPAEPRAADASGAPPIGVNPEDATDTGGTAAAGEMAAAGTGCAVPPVRPAAAAGTLAAIEAGAVARPTSGCAGVSA